MRYHVLPLMTLAAAPALTGCGDAADAATSVWRGTMDTLPSGTIVVENPQDPLWRRGQGWRVVEELRIGALEGDGPDLFGSITSLAVDDLERIWVLEGQAQEIRVFEPDGRFVRTVGREGGGPGEFGRALQVRRGPDGTMRVMDPQNNRFSAFDTAGTYLEGRRVPGGFTIIPWPGDYDRDGFYYGPVPLPSDDLFALGLTKFDTTFQPVDTLQVPRDPIERDRFELRGDGGIAMASIPFSGGFDWELSPSGTIWGLLTDDYRLTRFSQSGDTLRVVTKPFDPVPVTDEDMAAAEERLEWFVNQGGKIDLSKVPSMKPPVDWFFVDDEENLWVVRTVAGEEDDRILDVFDREGRFLGTVTLPFAITRSPAPTVRDGTMWAVTEDDLEVPYVVRARIEKPSD